MDISAGNFPIDIIIFALLAGFLILRLRSVLGKKTGFERDGKSVVSTAASLLSSKSNQKQPLTDAAPKVPEQPKTIYNIPSSDSENGQNLVKIAQLDNSFDAQKFLAGTEIVFRKVLTAFQAEDLKTLQTMLLTDTYNAFENAITARRNALETQKIEIKNIHAITISNVHVIDDQDIKRAAIEVQIVSDQINCVFDKDKNPVVGTESVTEFIDFWTFERLLGINTQGISWRLKSARSGS